MLFATSRMDLRSAMQWWQNTLMKTSLEQAEYIRHSPLQELHALQRHLELASLSVSAPIPEQIQLWVNTLQALYCDLERVSEHLSAPQVSDLALAIKQRVPLWKSCYPKLSFSLDDQPFPGESHHNRLLLCAVEALLRIVSHYTDFPLSLSLSQSENKGLLLLATQFEDYELELPVSFHKELAYLRTSFAYLDGGCFEQEVVRLDETKNFNFLFNWPINLSNSQQLDRGVVKGADIHHDL